MVRTLAWWRRWYRSLPFFDPPVRRLNKSTKELLQEIDAILYSELSSAERLERLKPFVAVGEHARLFTRRTGLTLRCDFCLGPYPTDYSVPGCGLELVMDDLYWIHIIRRAHRRVRGIKYPAQSLSDPMMRVEGYTRDYHG